MNLEPDQINCVNIENDNSEVLIDKIFPNFKSCTQNKDFFNKRAVLTPKNEDVDSINDSLISHFPGTATSYKSFDSVLDDQACHYPSEFLNTLCPAGMSPHELILKPNCPVILLRNLDPPNGLCNGTRMICKKFFKNIIHCEITMGYYKGEQVFLPRITFRPSTSRQYPLQFQRKQFPIKLCFAMTINKAQGQTLDKVAIYLRQPCFSYGQLYVALSSATKRADVTIFTNGTTETSDENSMVKNIVSFEILRKAKIIEADVHG